MAFVNEKIPEEHWDMVNYWGLKNCDHKPISVNKDKYWTVDYEKEAYLIDGLHHFSDDFEKLALIWKESKIIIKVKVRYLGDTGKRYGEYKVFDIRIPMNLKGNEEECLALVKDALWTKSQMGPECGRRPVNIYITEDPKFI